jgi:hypothetical protein
MAYTFGIELEFMGGGSRSRVAEAMTRRGVMARPGAYSENAAAAGMWLVKPDGSCEFEAVSPILSLDDVARVVPMVCQAIRDCGGDARDERCGFHVHVAGFNNDVKAVRNTVRRFINFEDTFDMCQPEKRRGNANSFCKSNATLFGDTCEDQTVNVWDRAQRATSLQALRDLFNPHGDRYFKINLQSLVRHGTLEMRHHGGTLNAETVHAWTVFLDAFVRTAEQQERLWKRPVGKVETQAERFRKMTRNVPVWAAKRIRMRAAHVNGFDPFA